MKIERRELHSSTNSILSSRLSDKQTIPITGSGTRNACVRLVVELWVSMEDCFTFAHEAGGFDDDGSDSLSSRWEEKEKSPSILVVSPAL